MNPRTRYAILYARFSPRPDAAHCESIDFQFERLRAWCKAMGYEILDEFSDEEASGKDTNRNGLQDAIYRTCRNRAILCVTAVDRLSRVGSDALAIRDRVLRARGDIAILELGLDTATPIGKAVYTIRAAFAEFERETIVERTSTSMKRHQANGRRMGRPDKCPYGQMPDPNDPSRLIQCPEEQAVIARILALHAEGISSRGICTALDTEGLARRGGKTWHNAHRMAGIIVNRSLYQDRNGRKP